MVLCLCPLALYPELAAQGLTECETLAFREFDGCCVAVSSIQAAHICPSVYGKATRGTPFPVHWAVTPGLIAVTCTPSTTQVYEILHAGFSGNAACNPEAVADEAVALHRCLLPDRHAISPNLVPTTRLQIQRN
jgi:hypothetical protein